MPVAIPPLSGPGWFPGEQVSSVPATGGGGLVVRPLMEGVAVAVGSTPSTEVPQIQNLSDPGTGLIVSEWEISRGRSYELDRNQAGTATITLIDLTGALDISGGSTIFAIGTPVTIGLDDPLNGGTNPVYTGYVERVEYDLYQTEDYAICTVNLVDGTDRLARTEMHPGEGFVLEWGDFAADTDAQDGDLWFDADTQVEHRINQILDQAQWPASKREVFSGNVSLQATVYAYRTPALTAIMDAADAEQPAASNFYIGKEGNAVFHGRQARFRPAVAQYHIAIWSVGDLAAVTASPGRALIFELAYDLDVDKVINVSIATPKGIDDADIDDNRVEDSGSISAYGPRSEGGSWDNLITAADYFGADTPKAATRKFAEYVVANFAEPLLRINKLVFKYVGDDPVYGPAIKSLMSNVEISDLIRITTTHLGGGFSDDDFFVEGIRMNARPKEIVLELDVSPRAHYETNPFD